MSRCFELIAYYFPFFCIKEKGRRKGGDLYKRIQNVYGLRYNDQDENVEDEVILLNPTGQTVNTVTSLDVRDLLRKQIAEIEEDLRSEPRSRDYVEQAKNLIDRYRSYVEIADAFELSDKVLDTDMIASLSEMSSGAFGKFAKARTFDEVVKPKLSYVSPLIQPSSSSSSSREPSQSKSLAMVVCNNETISNDDDTEFKGTESQSSSQVVTKTALTV